MSDTKHVENSESTREGNPLKLLKIIEQKIRVGWANDELLAWWVLLIAHSLLSRRINCED